MNIHLIKGDSPHKVKAKLKEITKQYKEQSYEIVELVASADFESEFFGFSLFVQTKLIIIDLERCTGELFGQFLLDRIDSPAALRDGIAIIFVSIGKFDQRLKIYKHISNLAKDNIHELNEFKPWEKEKIIEYLEQLVKQKNLSLDKAAANKIYELYGNHIEYFDTELDKLANYTNHQPISYQVVELLSAEQADTIRVINAILQKNITHALELLEQLSQRIHFIPILASLQTNFRHFVMLSSLKGQSLNDITYMIFPESKQNAMIFNKNKFRLSKDLEKLKKISYQELITLLKALNLLEYHTKTGKVYDPLLKLKSLLLTIR